MTQTDQHTLLPAAVPQLRFRTFRTISALIVREMTTTYGRSPGGYLWAVLQPAAMIGMLAVAFSLLLRSPSLGTSFILFYATGILALQIYQTIGNNVATAMSYNKALLGYPRVTYIDAILARGILALLTQILVIATVLAGIFAIQDVRIILNFGPIFEATAFLVLLGFGVGTLNCFLFLMFPVWKTVWTIAMRPLMLVSAVLYIYEDLPWVAQQYLWYNPLAHTTGLMRQGFYSYYNPNYISIPYLLIWSVLPLVTGLVLLRRYNQDLLFR